VGKAEALLIEYLWAVSTAECLTRFQYSTTNFKIITCSKEFPKKHISNGADLIWPVGRFNDILAHFWSKRTE
jgi:hypothetical protein